MGIVASLGSWFGSWWKAPDDEEDPTEVPHPATGLTAGQVKAVQRTFAVLRTDVKEFGVDLFMELFETHPQFQKLFKSFASVPKAELPGNKRFIAHATTVAYSILNIVDNLDEPECLVELLTRIGCNHGRRNIQPKAFQDLRNVILLLLKKKFGTKFTPFVEASWAKTLDVANSVIYKGLEDGKLEAANSTRS